jgi:dTDP-4-dehydrorhamnose reductase
LKKKIIFTGGDGRFARNFLKFKNKYDIKFLNSKELNILSNKSIKDNIIKYRPFYLIHNAGLSRPMIKHEKDINESIEKNIIGTCNIVRHCSKNNIKLIYFSTNYVYPCKKGNYTEEDPLLPVNNYAWSKLGGECAVQMYTNSLILRLAISEKPFIHAEAFKNIKSSFMYHDKAASIIMRLIDKKGIINIGGRTQSIYDFAKSSNITVKGITYKKNKGDRVPKNSSMSVRKLKSLISND